MGDAGADKHCGIDRSYEEPMPMPLTSRAAQVTSRAAQGLACAQRWKSAFSLLDRQQGVGLRRSHTSRVRVDFGITKADFEPRCRGMV